MLRELYNYLVQLAKSNKKRIIDFYWYFALGMLITESIIVLSGNHIDLIVIVSTYILILLNTLMRYWK